MTDQAVVEFARSFVEKDFRTASAALLAGSAGRGQMTDTSDIDIVVVEEGTDSLRSVQRVDDRLVELFVFRLDALRRTIEREAQSRMRVPFHASMCADAVVLLDTDSVAGQLQELARKVLSDGPVKASDRELEDLRYMLTSALDDLASATDASERTFEGMYVAQLTARLTLARAGGWLGQGRWLYRSLSEVDPALASDLANASSEGDVAALGKAARGALDEAGGPLFEGYRRELRAPEG